VTRPSAEAWATALANQGLVHFVLKPRARRLRQEGVYDDAVQDGMLGLARAAETFDPDRGAFSTYAVGWIRQAVQRGEGVREGINFRRAFIHGDRASRQEARDALVPVLSIDALLPGADSATVADTLAGVDDTEAAFLEEEQRARVARAAATAGRTQLERDVVAHMLGLGAPSLVVIADGHGIPWHAASRTAGEIRERLAHPAAGLNTEPGLVERACSSAPLLMFFPLHGEPQLPAEELCARCPVVERCSALARARDASAGVWGGRGRGGRGGEAEAAQMAEDHLVTEADRVELLEGVVRVYRAALAEGQDPDEAVATHLGRHLTNARRRVKQARKRGMLGAAEMPAVVSRSRRPPPPRLALDVVVEDLAEERRAEAGAFDELMADVDALLVVG
jgi:RNA polymerase sigma factor (sigma-70 family)